MIVLNAFRRRVMDVPCTIDIERTAHSLHAHVELEGVEVDAGDEVLVHVAREHVAQGTQFTLQRRATVVHAGWIKRAWTRLFSRFELTLLFEVSFSTERWQAATRPTYKPLPRNKENARGANATKTLAAPSVVLQRVVPDAAPHCG